jgi:hypothetical protein
MVRSVWLPNVSRIPGGGVMVKEHIKLVSALVHLLHVKARRWVGR